MQGIHHEEAFLLTRPDQLYVKMLVLYREKDENCMFRGYND